MRSYSKKTAIIDRHWLEEAILKIEADFNRSADTHLFKLSIPTFKGIEIYLKDESTHPTGSLKHRLARSLFLYGLCNGKIQEGTTIIEASSGSTAVSEAYFAKLLGLPFIAVIPRSTSEEKIAQILFYGGKVHLVDAPATVYSESERLEKATGGYYMDQFTFAERATDWRGNNNIAESIFTQLQYEKYPTPSWIVCGAGTGGTSATLGRFIRYRRLNTQICVVDPENSVFYDYYLSKDKATASSVSSRIEGIGRPRVEASFLPEVIDRMIRVPDAASLAAMYHLESLIGKKCGGSTGTNFYGVLQLAHEMIQNNLQGSIISLICDSGDRYTKTYYDESWIAKKGLNLKPYFEQIKTLLATGQWDSV